MTNKNCLDGFWCPHCGQEDEFVITARAQILMSDEGASEVPWEGDGHLAYNSASPALCPGCGLRGAVATFQPDGWPRALSR